MLAFFSDKEIKVPCCKSRKESLIKSALQIVFNVIGSIVQNGFNSVLLQPSTQICLPIRLEPLTRYQLRLRH